MLKFWKLYRNQYSKKREKKKNHQDGRIELYNNFIVFVKKVEDQHKNIADKNAP